MTIDPDKPCPHENFYSKVEINRLTSRPGAAVEAFIADVHIYCDDCNEVFRFIGMLPR